MKLSLCMRGRNDQYGGKFIERTNYCLQRHIDNFKYCNLTPNDVEIVFVDWGSEHSIIPHLIQNTYGFLRYIVVPSNVTRLYDPPETFFSFVHSINVAIRRAYGEHIMHIDSDVFMYEDSMERLWKYLQRPNINQYHHYFSRYEVPNITTADNPYNIMMVHTGQPKDFHGGSTAIMCHRDIWYAAGGYDELYVHWGNQDLELYTRLYNMGYTSIDLYRECGVMPVHIKHDHFFSAKGNSYLDYLHPISNNPTGPTWGLGDYTFTEYHQNM